MSTFRNIYKCADGGLRGGDQHPTRRSADENAATGWARTHVLEEGSMGTFVFHEVGNANDPTEGLEFIVWVPSSSRPVTTKFRTRAQAQSCAHRLAEKEGVEAYVCALTDVVNPPPKAKSERKALL